MSEAAMRMSARWRCIPRAFPFLKQCESRVGCLVCIFVYVSTYLPVQRSCAFCRGRFWYWLSILTSFGLCVFIQYE